jgi:hypothetical protein
MVDKFAILTIESTFGLYFLAFILIDFASYWSHRFNHEINVMWNRHIVHHSSEEFNLSCALRQSISGIIGVYFFLYIPMAFIGIPTQVVAITAPLHLFAQFWYHTRLIKRMGFLEKILVTPSHHRVHHAINPEYIDKNYAAIFIFWDKWFGTFQEEQDDIPPVYGVKRPVRTWNPILINYMHMWQLFKDTWRTKNWLDKGRVWFMPTGWRPDDVSRAYPIKVVEDVFALKKYDTPASELFKYWSWFQLVMNNLLMYYMLVKIGDFAFTDIIWYAVFLLISIFAYTSLMDGHRLGLYSEVVKFVFGIALFIHMGGWYGLDQILPAGSILMAGYLMLSLLATLHFYYREIRSHLTMSMSMQ